MLRTLLGLALVFAASIAASAQTAQQAPAGPVRRVALVVGVANYREPLKPLANPVRDARRIAEVLRLNRFAVTFVEDPDHAGFVRIVDGFASSSRGAEEAVVFFSGHGMAVVEGGKLVNALAPVDAAIDCRTRNAQRIIGMEQILERLAHVPKKVALFDACRSDPFLGCTGPGAGGYGFREIAITDGAAPGRSAPTRDVAGTPGRGFEPVPQPPSISRMLISYASDLGGLALDGEPGAHSPFTEALLAELQSGARVPFGEMLDKTSQRVASLTSSFQVPWVVTRGGEPDMCLAGSGCEARGRLRQDRALSDALGAALDAQRLRGTRDLHDALARVTAAIEDLRAAGIDIPQPLLRQFQELLVLTPKRQLTRLADLIRLGLSLDQGALNQVVFSGDGRIGALQETSGRVAVVDFETMKVVQRLPGSASDPAEVTLSPRGDRVVMCRHGGRTQKCVVAGVADGRIDRVVDLPEGFIVSGTPVFAPNDAFVAWAGLDAGRGRRGYRIIVEPLDASRGRVTIELPRDEDAKKRDVIDGLLMRVSPAGNEIAVLSPARLHLFRESGGSWTGAFLDGLYERLGEPYGYNTQPSFDFDFATRRFAFATPAISVVIGDVDIAGGRLVAKQHFQFKDCSGCSVLGIARGGREIVLAGLGTDGHVGVFALPVRLEWTNVGEVFRIRQTARQGHYGHASRTVVVYDINGAHVQRLDLAGHPVHTAYTLPGRDQVWLMPGRTPGRVLVYDTQRKVGLDLDPATGVASGEHAIAERSAYDHIASTLAPGATVDRRLFLHDDRYGHAYGRDSLMAAATGTKDRPVIRFYLPMLGGGPNPSSATADERTLLVAGDGNGRIDVLRLPLSVDEQLAAARQILAAGSKARP